MTFYTDLDACDEFCIMLLYVLPFICIHIYIYIYHADCLTYLLEKMILNFECVQFPAAMNSAFSVHSVYECHYSTRRV